MTADASLSLTQRGALGWITIQNASRMNALTSAMWASLPALISEADENPDIRVIILRGTGERAFCAGADISEFESARTGENAKIYDQLNHNAFLAIAEAGKPTLAMIHGFCLGGGLGLAACCDFRIADTNSQYAIPAAKLGIGYNPRWVTPLLALTSPAKVKDLLFTGRRVKAEEAASMGLVNHVYEPDTLEAETVAFAQTIAANAPLSIAASKLVVNELMHRPETPDLYKLDQAVQRCFESADYKEGQRAFLEKRAPKFQGQ